MLCYDLLFDLVLWFGFMGDMELICFCWIVEEEFKCCFECVEGVVVVFVSGGLEEEI